MLMDWREMAGRPTFRRLHGEERWSSFTGAWSDGRNVHATFMHYPRSFAIGCAGNGVTGCPCSSLVVCGIKDTSGYHHISFHRVCSFSLESHFVYVFGFRELGEAASITAS